MDKPKAAPHAGNPLTEAIRALLVGLGEAPASPPMTEGEKSRDAIYLRSVAIPRAKDALAWFEAQPPARPHVGHGESVRAAHAHQAQRPRHESESRSFPTNEEAQIYCDFRFKNAGTASDDEKPHLTQLRSSYMDGLEGIRPPRDSVLRMAAWLAGADRRAADNLGEPWPQPAGTDIPTPPPPIYAQLQLAGFRDLETAPKDGTAVELLVIHLRAFRSISPISEGLIQIVRGYWLKDRWSWEGSPATPVGWRFPKTPADLGQRERMIDHAAAAAYRLMSGRTAASWETFKLLSPDKAGEIREKALNLLEKSRQWGLEPIMPVERDVYITTARMPRCRIDQLPPHHRVVHSEPEGWALHEAGVMGPIAGGGSICWLIIEAAGIKIFDSSPKKDADQ